MGGTKGKAKRTNRKLRHTKLNVSLESPYQLAPYRFLVLRFGWVDSFNLELQRQNNLGQRRFRVTRRRQAKVYKQRMLDHLILRLTVSPHILDSTCDRQAALQILAIVRNPLCHHPQQPSKVKLDHLRCLLEQNCPQIS